MERNEKHLEAFKYVNSRYIFNEDNYKGFGQLAPEHQLSFAINHSMYHLLKSLFNLTRCERAKSSFKDKVYEAAAVKTVVNLIKLAEVLGATQESFVAIQPAPHDSYYSHLPLGTLVEDFMTEFATKLEAADHSGKHNIATLRAILEDYWAKILSAVSLFLHDTELKLVDAYALFPEYMKSK